MQDSAQRREELERVWKDPSFVRRWTRERKRFLHTLDQKPFRDENGAWNPNPVRDGDTRDSVEDDTPSSPVFANPRAVSGASPDKLRRRRKRGDPEFILPDPVVSDGAVKFPLAQKVGASGEQLAQAAAMYAVGLKTKAQRKAHCSVLGERRDCISNSDHRFYVPYRCGNRYCATCGPHIFAHLFAKYRLLEGVARSLVPHWPVHGHRPARVIAKIDFTIHNTGEMPGPEAVKKFNQDIRKFFQLLERKLGISRKDYGVLWCDEFGGSNTNLHAHGVYAGPFLSQKKKELSDLWSEVVGERAFVSIKAARSFPAALAHALKYPGKYVRNSTPERLAELEKAFHRVRRVHALRRFYNVKPGDALEPPENWAGSNSCPLCGGSLGKILGWHLRPIPELEKEGVKNMEDVRREMARERAFGPRGSPPG